MPTTSRELQAARTRTELEDAARVVFARTGYLAAKITDITREAGRSTGSFYNHFDSKDALLLALAERLGEEADAIVAAQDPVARTARTMRPHLEVFWRIFGENRTVIDALRDAALVSDELSSRVEEFTILQFEPWVDRLRGFESDGVELPASPAVTAQLVAGAAESFARRWTGEPSHGLDALVDFVDRAVFGPLVNTRPDQTR
ncbi:TetR/AcrR family transcriptional regulator [Rhodococcus sp. NPDC057297]|uniref:TetR/AcrR family transcriptional regulator n=1 Tax=Rhodococcus sp. NPDC057297 TaxID=3346090 RepID=UPI003625DD5A